MEPQLLLWICAFLTLLFVVLGAWQRKIARVEEDAVMESVQDSKARGTDRAIAQHPQIDPYVCIGCATCVSACPEEGVIGLVSGVAHIIHGSHCIGHGRCEEACPVGALTVGLGDVASRPDIPLLSDELETSVPGVYIAGELGGFALIRNAVGQGTRAVENAFARLRSSGRQRRSGRVLDLLVVGAGPAGLAASLKATEYKLSFATIDQEDVGGTVRKYPRRKLTMTQPFDLPLYGRMRKNEYVKEELIDLWEGLIRDFALDIHSHVRLLGLQRHSDYLLAETSQGKVAARSVVLALGRRGTPRRLGVPGEESEKVLYQLIDAATYTNKRILVVGGGDSAIEAATGLANQRGNRVVLSYRKKNFFRLKRRNEERINDYVRTGKVRTVFSSTVKRIDADSVTLARNDGGSERIETFDNDFVFVFAGGEPPYPLLKRMGIRFGGDEDDVAARTVRARQVTR